MIIDVYNQLHYDLPLDDSSITQSFLCCSGILRDAGLAAPSLHGLEEATIYWEKLYNGEITFADSEKELRAAEISEQSADDSWAAAFACMTVVHAWEGRAQPDLGRTKAGARNWGWHGLVLPLARTLQRAGALWAGRKLTSISQNILSRAGQGCPWHTESAQQEIAILRKYYETLYIRERDNAAHHFSEVAKQSEQMRATLAAVWWTLGVPALAHSVATGKMKPTAKQVKLLLDDFIRKNDADALLWQTVGSLWRVPQTDPVLHPTIYKRTAWFYPIEESAVRLAQRDPHIGCSASAVYSSLLNDLLANRPIRGDAVAFLDYFSLRLPQSEALTGIRFDCLRLLIEDWHYGVTSALWSELTIRAREVLAELEWRVDPARYDRTLDIPLYYLGTEDDDGLRTLEEHRSAAVEFHTYCASTQRDGDEAGHAQAGKDVEEVRKLRFIMALNDLPSALGEAFIVSWQPGEDVTAWSNRERAQARLIELQAELRKYYRNSEPATDTGTGERPVLATLAELLPTSTAKPFTLVTFRLRYAVEFGESIRLVGNISELGDWCPGRGISLNWTPGHIWEGVVKLSGYRLSEMLLEYKYLWERPMSAAQWECGQNHVRKVSLTEKRILFIDSWNSR